MENQEPKIILIGAGIMSATLGILIKKLIPGASISIYERLDKVAAESSDAWNNAGTGHSAFCELNYTPQLEDGSVNIDKALNISESFEISKQLWAHLIESGDITDQTPFINDIDHMSFVWGNENVEFLKKRHKSMIRYAMFADMTYTEDPARITEWVPLMMNGRERTEPLAATRMAIGTDVNFGLLTREMIAHLQQSEQVQMHLGHEVEDISRLEDGRWHIEVIDLHTRDHVETICDYVFIGAGGGSLPLLDKADIPEARGYAGFPVSGQFLRCKNQEVIKQHEAKVYGKATAGSPPMSVPHLDTRVLDGTRSLLFGPYAGFSTKFLKNGSYLDLPLSIEMHNVWPLLSAGIHNIALTKYLIKQVRQKPEDRFRALQAYYPNADADDWELAIAGQRVQIIKKDKEGGGVLKFGTEIVCSADQTLAALLGASPGASTSVAIMIDVLQQMFPMLATSAEARIKLQEMIPSFGQSLITDGKLCLKTRERTTKILKLEA
jgi:malate dehydrogenase (quinone)